MESPPTGARKAIPFLVASIASKPIGFLREMLVAAVYGSGVARDAFLIAWQIPNLIGGFVTEGLPQTLVPYMAEINRHEQQRRILSGILGLLAAAFVLLAAVIFVAAAPFVRLVAPFASPETIALATTLLRALAFSVALTGASAVLTALLFARGRFIAATLAVPLMNLVIMIVVVLGHRAWGIHALAYGVLIGTAVMALSLVHGVFVLPSAPVAALWPQYRRFFALLSTFFVGTLLFSVNAVVEKVFASRLPAGSISNLDYAFRIVQMLFTLLAAIPTFLFPRLSELATDERTEGGMHVLLAKGVHVTLLLGLPVAAVLWALRQPIVEVVYQRGAFDRTAAGATAEVLGWYALGLGAHALNNMVVHAFYARREIRVRLGYGLVFLVANTAGNLVLAGSMGARGIALAHTLAAGVASIYLLVQLRRRMAASVDRFFAVLWKSALTAAVVAALTVLVERVIPGPVVVRLAAAAAVATGAFLALVQSLRIEGAVYLWDLLRMVRAK
jgi:putative peptidoglycan lipid II flippase